ncbi:MAG: hypothetical protein ACTSRE_03380 [Promethearchaeota archaeon]
MWRKYRESISTKKLKRIKGRKTSLIYQKQVLTVQEIFTYTSSKRVFYHFYVKGNLPHIQKNTKKSQFLAIQLSKGSSALLLKLIREVLKREGSKRFFFIQYPIYPQFNINYLLLLMHIQDETSIPQYEDSLRGVFEKYTQAIEKIISSAF